MEQYRHFVSAKDVNQKLVDKIKAGISRLCYDLKDIDSGEIENKIKEKNSPWLTEVEIMDAVVKICNSMVNKSPDYKTLAERILISRARERTEELLSEHQGLVDKIKARVSLLGYDLKDIDSVEIENKIKEKISPCLTEVEIMDLIAEICNSMAIKSPNYAILAARIGISRLHKQTKEMFSDVLGDIYNYSTSSQMISTEMFSIVQENADKLNSAINHDMDHKFSYSAFKVLEMSLLTKINDEIVERPQHLFMRVAVGIHGRDLESVIETYTLLSEHCIILDLPILLNAGMFGPRLSSALLIKEESLEQIELLSGLFEQLDIGLGMHDVKALNTKTGISLSVEPWQKDLLHILSCHGSLKLCLSIPDLFMERLENNEDWTLICPSQCPNLFTVWGDEFVKLYQRYEKEGLGEVVSARTLWSEILACQSKKGMPFMVFKDSCNMKSNQKNLGTISSSLCTEIMQYVDCNQMVCNAASIALNWFVKVDRVFDFNKLEDVITVAVKNLNKIIDINNFETCTSNKRHRPIGLGVQGLADTFILMRCPFESIAAKQLNKDIFETIYFSALKTSCELSRKLGPYENYEGSPISKGIIQPDMWGENTSKRHDWGGLRENIKKYGIRNSLLVALMPTLSTASIFENSDSIEPHTSLSWVNLSGEYQINKHLLNDLMNMDLWNSKILDLIIANEGSIQNVALIPADIKALYKTAWEIPPKVIIDMAADRGPFVDQSQSLTLYMTDPSYHSINDLHFYGWRKGLKTGMYYLRTEHKPIIPIIQCAINEPSNRNYGLPPAIIPAYANIPIPINWPPQNLGFPAFANMPNNLDEIFCILREQTHTDLQSLLIFTKKIISTEIEEIAKYITKFLEKNELSFNLSFGTVLQNTTFHTDHRIKAVSVRHKDLRMVIVIDSNMDLFYKSTMILLNSPFTKQAILYFGDATIDGWRLKGNLANIPTLTQLFAAVPLFPIQVLGLYSKVCTANKFEQVFRRKILNIGGIKLITSGENNLIAFLKYVNDRLLCESPAGNNY